MKKLAKVIGIIALVAVIGFTMAVCKEADEDDSSENPFVGAWIGTGMTLVCTSSTWSITVSGQGNFSGSYIYSGNIANFKDTTGGEFGTAVVSGNVMSVVSTYGTFTFSK